MTLHRSIGAALEASGTVGTTPIDVRKDFERLFIRDGLLPGSAAPLVVGTTGFAYRVGKAGFVTQTAANDGYHLWGNDGNVDISLSDTGAALTAPASGLSRWDVIYARHPSNGENSDATSAPLLAVAKGVASSPSPAVPAIPDGAKELARNLMTSAATSTSSSGNTITQTIGYTAPRGGAIPCRTATERDALVSLASAENPILADLLTNGLLYRSVGGAFAPVTIGPWTAWTPTISGFAVGTTGSPVAETVWRYNGDMIDLRWRFVFGTNGTVTFSGGATITLPVPSLTSEFHRAWPMVVDRPGSGLTHPAWARMESTTVLRFTLPTTPVTGEFPRLTDVTSSTPWGGSWAAADAMSGSASYRWV